VSVWTKAMTGPTNATWFRVTLATAIALAVMAAPATSQEPDNAIYHFSLLDVDAARSSGPAVGRWSGAGWIGTDFDRLWWSTEGEGLDGEFDDVEAQALYGRYVRRFWDLVAGYRQDFQSTTQGYLAFGIMGLAPYWFEVSALGFVSQRGKPSIRFEADLDLYVTQRLVLTPDTEVEWLITSDDALDLAAGFADVEFGLRARYELRRKFAPYVDFRWVSERAPRTLDPQDISAEGFRLGLGLRLIY
jgi:copper resistance protein B